MCALFHLIAVCKRDTRDTRPHAWKMRGTIFLIKCIKALAVFTSNLHYVTFSHMHFKCFDSGSHLMMHILLLVAEQIAAILKTMTSWPRVLGNYSSILSHCDQHDTQTTDKWRFCLPSASCKVTSQGFFLDSRYEVWNLKTNFVNACVQSPITDICPTLILRSS